MFVPNGVRYRGVPLYSNGLLTPASVACTTPKSGDQWQVFLVVSNRWTELWTGLLDWTDGLDYWTSYHMTSIQSNVVNLVTVTTLL